MTINIYQPIVTSQTSYNVFIIKGKCQVMNCMFLFTHESMAIAFTDFVVIICFFVSMCVVCACKCLYKHKAGEQRARGQKN